MCDICLMNPCHPRCPNFNQKIINVCEFCGEEIYEGELYYTDNNEYLYCCEECAKMANGIREVGE